MHITNMLIFLIIRRSNYAIGIYITLQSVLKYLSKDQQILSQLLQHIKIFLLQINSHINLIILIVTVQKEDHRSILKICLKRQTRNSKVFFTRTVID